MHQLAGLSYGHSLAYPHRTRSRIVAKNDNLLVVMGLVHPDNLGALPPSPTMLAFKGEQIGIAKFEEFFERRYY